MMVFGYSLIASDCFLSQIPSSKEAQGCCCLLPDWCFISRNVRHLL